MVATLHAAEVKTLADLTVRVPRRRRWWIKLVGLGSIRPREIVPAVRDNPRHSSVATTLVYLHTDDLRRPRQLREAFASNGSAS